MNMYRYPIEVIASREDIEHIEFNRSKMFILFKDGLVAEYSINFIDHKGGDMKNVK